MPDTRPQVTPYPTIREAKHPGRVHRDVLRVGRVPTIGDEEGRTEMPRGQDAKLLAEDARADQSHAADIPLEVPERGGPPVAVAIVPERVQVDVDTVIVRTDLGSTDDNKITTRIAANDFVPFGLESLPREPA